MIKYSNTEKEDEKEFNWDFAQEELMDHMEKTRKAREEEIELEKQKES